MKLDIREIATAMVGPREVAIDFRTPPHGGVTYRAQQIPLRKVLAEMGPSTTQGPNLTAELALSSTPH